MIPKDKVASGRDLFYNNYGSIRAFSDAQTLKG